MLLRALLGGRFYQQNDRNNSLEISRTETSSFCTVHWIPCVSFVQYVDQLCKCVVSSTKGPRDCRYTRSHPQSSFHCFPTMNLFPRETPSTAITATPSRAQLFLLEPTHPSVSPPRPTHNAFLDSGEYSRNEMSRHDREAAFTDWVHRLQEGRLAQPWHTAWAILRPAQCDARAQRLTGEKMGRWRCRPRPCSTSRSVEVKD